MANEAYICRIDQNLDAGVVQITDLRPNTSRRSLTYEKVPQSGYMPAYAENDDVTAAANPTAVAYSGLSAYLLDVTAQSAAPGGNGLAPAMADGAATLILADMASGDDIDLARITTHLVASGAAAGTSISSAGGGDSVGSLADVLKILAGGAYTVPAGTTVNGAAAFKGSADGSFDDDGYRQIYQSGALSMSVSEGDLAQWITDGYCVVYDDAGAVLS